MADTVFNFKTFARVIRESSFWRTLSYICIYVFMSLCLTRFFHILPFFSLKKISNVEDSFTKEEDWETKEEDWETKEEDWETKEQHSKTVLLLAWRGSRGPYGGKTRETK